MTDWQELLASEGGAVWRTAYRILGNTGDTEECFQEVFLDALRLARRENVENWRAMLQRLTTRRAIDKLRQHARRMCFQSQAELAAVASRDPPPSASAEQAETGDRLRKALAAIPEKQAEVFCLHALEGWSYREIAAHLKMPVDTVGVQLHRARKHLRGHLADLAENPRSSALTSVHPPTGKEES